MIHSLSEDTMQTIGLRFNHGVLENLFELSKQYFDNGAMDDAARTLEAYSEAMPGDAEAIALKGRILAQQGRQVEAAAAFAEAIRIAPRAGYYLDRARALRGSGQAAEALACMDIARLQLGELASFEMEALECERDLKNYGAALDRNLRLLRSPGPNEELLEMRGDLYAEAGMDDEALAAWKQALKALVDSDGVVLEGGRGMRDRLQEKIGILGGVLED
jgi:tetratricopeptide (TPR) repeat protein